MKGKLFVMSGPSGTGKSTVVNAVTKLYGNLHFSVSATTREPRPGELDGREYYFVSRERFLEMAQSGQLLEHAQYVENFYGTTWSRAGFKFVAPDSLEIWHFDGADAYTVTDVDTVAVVGKVFGKKWVAHDDIASGLQIAVAGDPFADLLQPPGAVFIAGAILVFQKIVTVLKGVAPEVVFHALEAVFVKENIQSATDIVTNLFLTDIQRCGLRCPVVVVDEPFRMHPVDGGVFGAESPDPDGRSQTDFANLIGVGAQAPGELFVLDALFTFIRHSETVGGGDIDGVTVIHLDPAERGEIGFEEPGFFQEHLFRDLP